LGYREDQSSFGEKTAAKLPALRKTVLEPDVNDAEARVLELDELWSFVLKKTKKAWIGRAVGPKTRQVVADASREIEVRKQAKNSGKPFLPPIVQDIAPPIVGVRIRQSYQKSTILREGKKRENRHRENAGRRHCDNV